MKKGDIVTVGRIVRKGKIEEITIEEMVVESSGKVYTRFKETNSDFSTDVLCSSIEELQSLNIMPVKILPTEKHVQAYISRDKELRQKGIAKAKRNLMKNPTSRRFKSHLEMWSKEYILVDKRIA